MSHVLLLQRPSMKDIFLLPASPAPNEHQLSTNTKCPSLADSVLPYRDKGV